jgi:hypothetical protein
MDSDGEIRRYAREAEEMAVRSRNDKERASWLGIAQSWLKMLSSRGPSAEDHFENDAPHARHERSKESH